MNEVESFRDLRLNIPGARESHCQRSLPQDGSTSGQELGESSPPLPPPFLPIPSQSRASATPPPKTPQPPGLPRPSTHRRRKTVDGSEGWPSIQAPLLPSSPLPHNPLSSPLPSVLHQASGSQEPLSKQASPAKSTRQSSTPRTCRSPASSVSGSSCCNFHCSCGGGGCTISPGHSSMPHTCCHKSNSPTANRRASFSGVQNPEPTTDYPGWGSPRSAPPGEKRSPLWHPQDDSRSEIVIPQSEGFSPWATGPFARGPRHPFQRGYQSKLGVGPFQRQSWKQSGSDLSSASSSPGTSHNTTSTAYSFLSPWSTFRSSGGINGNSASESKLVCYSSDVQEKLRLDSSSSSHSDKGLGPQQSASQDSSKNNSPLLRPQGPGRITRPEDSLTSNCGMDSNQSLQGNGLQHGFVRRDSGGTTLPASNRTYLRQGEPAPVGASNFQGARRVPANSRAGSDKTHPHGMNVKGGPNRNMIAQGPGSGVFTWAARNRLQAPDT